MFAVAAVAALAAAQCALPPPLTGEEPQQNSTGFAHRHGKLRLGGADGLQLVDAKGDAVQLMGVSSHGLQWHADCVTADAITAVAATWGATVVRAAMYVGEGGYATKPSLKQVVLDIVEATRKAGLYVLVDWHVLRPGNPNDPLYAGADEFWAEMATRLANESHVLYEIANEPNGVSWAETLAYHNRIIGLIRKIDPETVIIAGTPEWSHDLRSPLEQPVAQPYNVMYTFHLYVGQQMEDVPHLITYGAKLPVFVTEWGEVDTNAKAGATVYVNRSLEFAEVMRNGSVGGKTISWAQWSYSDATGGAALGSGSCKTGAWNNVTCAGLWTRAYIRHFNGIV